MAIIEKDYALYEKQQDSDVLLVIFGGIRQGIGLPSFEFKNVLNEVPCNKLFLRDFKQAWYHYGISNDINSIELLQRFLENEISFNNYKKVVFLGNSMGGYAAILFGTLLNVSRILAFSPQTFIDKRNRFLHRDKRWKQEINTIYNIKNNKRENLDLKLLLEKNKDKLVSTTIYYSKHHKLDMKHCERLKGVSHFDLKPYDSESHNIVRQLRDEGQLIRIINSHCN